MIRTRLRTAAGGIQEGLSPEALDAALADPKVCLWIDICYAPGQKPEAEAFLKKHFRFHPLALDDALQEAHLSRIDDWKDYVYTVVHGLDLETNCTLDPQELDLFVSRNYLISIHDEPIAALDKVWNASGRGGDQRLSRGPDHLLYLLIDALIANYMPVVDGLDEEIDEIERAIYAKPAHGTVNRIFQLRRTLLRMRRLLGYLRETLNRLARDDFDAIDENERVYFRDAYDHVVRLFEIIEGLRDMAAGAMESYVSITSNRINEVMRTLTVVTVLFLPLGTLVGFFGMNFFAEGWAIRNPIAPGWWFALCMGLMLAIPPTMLYWIQRKGWLQSTLTEKKETPPRG